MQVTPVFSNGRLGQVSYREPKRMALTHPTPLPFPSSAAHLFHFKKFFKKLENNFFIVMCWFLPYINMNQPQVYVCPLPPEQRPQLPPHSLQGCHRAVGGALCQTANSHLLPILHGVMYMCMFPC